MYRIAQYNTQVPIIIIVRLAINVPTRLPVKPMRPTYAPEQRLRTRRNANHRIDNYIIMIWRNPLYINSAASVCRTCVTSFNVPRVRAPCDVNARYSAKAIRIRDLITLSFSWTREIRNNRRPVCGTVRSFYPSAAAAARSDCRFRLGFNQVTAAQSKRT